MLNGKDKLQKDIDSMIHLYKPLKHYVVHGYKHPVNI